jgi:substrate import-associated zinc metallohydrolase lipoprotein
MIRKIILYTLLLFFAAAACTDPYNEDIDPSKINYPGDGQEPVTELDQWLYNTFTKDFNIEVKYRWDASELNLFQPVVPPKVDKIQPVMDVVKKVWIDPYTQLAGENFIAKYSPKQFVLVGSARYNFNGTITLGTAEGGRKVVLYVINDFTTNDQNVVKQMLHTVEHEYIHILNQGIPYAAEFKDISSGLYTANWNLVSLAQARANGFITSYAMASPDEDFAEMASIMLIEGRERYENIIRCESSSYGYSVLKAKEALVVDYFKTAFNIDFYDLQNLVQQAINQIVPDPGNGENPPAPVLDQWGYDKAFVSLNFDLSMTPQSSFFYNDWANDNYYLHNAGYALDYSFEFSFFDPENIRLILHYYTTGTGERKFYEANFYYRFVPDESGKVTLNLIGLDDNARYLVQIGSNNLARFFNGTIGSNAYPFRIQWVQTCAGQWYVMLYNTANPGYYSLGVLGN